MTTHITLLDAKRKSLCCREEQWCRSVIAKCWREGCCSSWDGDDEKRESTEKGRLILGQVGSDQWASRRTWHTQIHGPQWDAPTSADVAGRTDCWTIYQRSWRDAWRPEESQCHSGLQKGQGGVTKKTTGQSASSPCPGRWWNNLSWMSFPSKWKRSRLSGVVNIGWQGGNHTWPVW